MDGLSEMRALPVRILQGAAVVETITELALLLRIFFIVPTSSQKVCAFQRRRKLRHDCTTPNCGSKLVKSHI
jgi:hypothetical protein